MSNTDSGSFDENNAAALADLLVNPATSKTVQLQIINEILESSKEETFFETMIQEEMSLGNCSFCGHQNHWLVPEDDLNTLGWVSYEKDTRVKQNTTIKDCEEFQEACLKKKTSI
jgi:hypothetical protein